MFDTPTRLLLGLISGIVFGFLLQKGRVAKHSVIVGAFLFRDLTAAKIMAVAAAVGSIGVYYLTQSGEASLHIKEAALGRLLTGGTFFGIGIVILGYCPGTNVAACGEGHKDAYMGTVGMLAGAGLYVMTFPFVQTVEESLPNWEKITLPQIFHTSPWLWVVGLVLAVMLANRLFTYKEHHTEGLPSQ
jgi:uncharacterized protein